MKKGEDFPGVTIVFLCHDGTGRYLLNKRSVNCRDEHGRWCPGAGGLELHDTVEDTLRKELAEEYGTDVLEAEFLGFRDVHREHEGKKTHWITLDFKVRIDERKAHNAEPHKFDDFQWFRLEEFPEPLHSQFPAFLEVYKGRL